MRRSFVSLEQSSSSEKIRLPTVFQARRALFMALPFRVVSGACQIRVSSVSARRNPHHLACSPFFFVVVVAQRGMNGLVNVDAFRPPLRRVNLYCFACVCHCCVFFVVVACVPRARLDASAEKDDVASPSLARADWTTIIIAVSTVGFVLLLIVNIVIVSCLCVRRRKKRMEEGKLHDARSLLLFIFFFFIALLLSLVSYARRRRRTRRVQRWR